MCKSENLLAFVSDIGCMESETKDKLEKLFASDGGCMVYGWIEVEESEPDDARCVVTLPVLRTGSRGDSVKAMQNLLIANKCSCGTYGADGKFGTATENAVMMFQDKKKLSVTGVCDSATWKKLLGA